MLSQKPRGISRRWAKRDAWDPALRLGELLYEEGDYTTAHTYLRQSLAVFEEFGDLNRSNHAYQFLSKLAMAQGNAVEAEELLEKAPALTSKACNVHGRAQVLDLMGRLAQQNGDYERAFTLHQESLAIWVEIGREARAIRSLGAFARLAARQGQMERRGIALRRGRRQPLRLLRHSGIWSVRYVIRS